MAKRGSLSIGALFAMLIMIALIGVGGMFIGTHHIVNTRDGIKVYPRARFGLSSPYVDMTSMSFLGLRHHRDVVQAMVVAGDLEYVPGGPTLLRIAEVGDDVMNAISKFDSETQVSAHLLEFSEKASNTFSEVDQQYNISGHAADVVAKASELDAQYDISGRAADAVGQAAEGISSFMNR
jgi:hypothetical protein